jgi:hypothetical protein
MKPVRHTGAPRGYTREKLNAVLAFAGYEVNEARTVAFARR